MHLLIPFAAPLSEAGRETLRTLRLPALDALLRQRGAGVRDDGDERTLSPPHERAIARALGWQGGDGTLPFGAREAELAGVPTDGLAWAVLTPVHCRVGDDGIHLLDPASLALDETESQALCEAVRPLFDGPDSRLVRRAALVWLAAHPALQGVATASLDRVIGRAVDTWPPAGDGARALRRLQVELQMTLHDHAVNAAREARGLPAVNSVWIAGCGTGQPAPAVELRVDDRLRAPALAEDWPAWSDALRGLDAGPLAALPPDATLTLCGERSALELPPGERGLWPRLRGAFKGERAAAVLETL